MSDDEEESKEDGFELEIKLGNREKSPKRKI